MSDLRDCTHGSGFWDHVQCALDQLANNAAQQNENESPAGAPERLRRSIPISGILNSTVDLYIPPTGKNGGALARDSRSLIPVHLQEAKATVDSRLNFRNGRLGHPDFPTVLARFRNFHLDGGLVTDNEVVYNLTQVFLDNGHSPNGRHTGEIVVNNPLGWFPPTDDLATWIRATQDLPVVQPIGLKFERDASGNIKTDVHGKQIAHVVCYPIDDEDVENSWWPEEVNEWDPPEVVVEKLIDFGKIDVPFPHLAELQHRIPTIDLADPAFFNKIDAITTEMLTAASYSVDTIATKGVICEHPRFKVDPPADPIQMLRGLNVSTVLYLDGNATWNEPTVLVDVQEKPPWKTGIEVWTTLRPTAKDGEFIFEADRLNTYLALDGARLGADISLGRTMARAEGHAYGTVDLHGQRLNLQEHTLRARNVHIQSANISGVHVADVVTDFDTRTALAADLKAGTARIDLVTSVAKAIVREINVPETEETPAIRARLNTLRSHGRTQASLATNPATILAFLLNPQGEHQISLSADFKADHMIFEFMAMWLDGPGAKLHVQNARTVADGWVEADVSLADGRISDIYAVGALSVYADLGDVEVSSEGLNASLKLDPGSAAYTEVSFAGNISSPQVDVDNYFSISGSIEGGEIAPIRGTFSNHGEMHVSDRYFDEATGERTISIPAVETSFNVTHENGLTAQGSVTEAKEAELSGKTIPSGIFITAEISSPREMYDADVTFNTALQNTTVAIPTNLLSLEGWTPTIPVPKGLAPKLNFKKGQTVGQVSLVNTGTPMIPIYLPEVAGNRIEVRNADLDIDLGFSLPFVGSRIALARNTYVTVTDKRASNGDAIITIRARNDIPAPKIDIKLPALFHKIPGTEKWLTKTNEGIAKLASRLHSGFTIRIPVDQLAHKDGKTYYDPTKIDSFAARFVVRLINRTISGATTVGQKEIVARGQANVSGLQSEGLKGLKVSSRAKVHFGERRFDLGQISATGQGTIDTRGGGIWLAAHVDKSKKNTRIITDIRPPRVIKVDTAWIDPQSQLRYQISGTVFNEALHRVEIDTEQKTVKLLQSGEAPQLKGNLKVTVQDANNRVVGEGRLTVRSSFEMTSSQTAVFALRAEKSSVKLTVDEGRLPLGNLPVIGDVALEKGTPLDATLHGFALELRTDIKTGEITPIITAANIGSEERPATLTIPGKALAVFLPKDPGPVKALLSVDMNGQQYAIHLDQNGDISVALHGERVDVKTRLEAVTNARWFKKQCAVQGKPQGICLDLESVSRADDLALHYSSNNKDEPIISFSLAKLLATSKVDGFLRLGNVEIDLTNPGTKAIVDKLEVSLNLGTGDLSLSLQAPQAPTYADPNNYEAWQNMTAAQWQARRDYFNGRDHLVTLPEDYAYNVPGNVLIPQVTDEKIVAGGGKIYVNLKAGTPQTYQTNLMSDQSIAEAITGLLSQVLGNLQMDREFLNIPRPAEPLPTERFVLDFKQDPQGRIFVLDRQDKQVATDLRKAFGLSDAASRRYAIHGQISLAFIAGREFMKPYGREATHALVKAIYESRSGYEFFPNKGKRLFEVLRVLRTGIGHGEGKLARAQARYWTNGEDAVRANATINFNDDLARDGITKKSGGTNMAFISYLEYPIAHVTPYFEQVEHQSAWMPWMDTSRKNADGSVTITYFGDKRAHVNVNRDGRGPIQAIHYRPTETNFENGLGLNLAGQVLLVPHRDPNGYEGTVVINFEVFDIADQDDVLTINGRDENLKPEGAPNAPVITDVGFDLPPVTINLAALGSRMKRLGRPSTDVPAQHAYRWARAMTHLRHALYEAISPQDIARLLNLKGKALLTADLRDTTLSPQNTRVPKEFIFARVEDVNGEGRQLVVELKVDKVDRPMVRHRLVAALGITESQADEIIEAKKLDLNFVAELPWVKKRFYPDSALNPRKPEENARLRREQVANLFFVYLLNYKGHAEDNQFLNRGKRALEHIKDIRLHAGRMSDEAGSGRDRRAYFRVNPPTDYQLGPSSRNDGDEVNSAGLFMLPAAGDWGVSFDTAARLFADPSQFTDTAREMIEMKDAPCSDHREGQAIVERCSSWLFNVYTGATRQTALLASLPLQVKFPAKPLYIHDLAVKELKDGEKLPEGAIAYAPWSKGFLSHDFDGNKLNQSTQGFLDNEGFLMSMRLWAGSDGSEKKETLVFYPRIANTRVDGDIDTVPETCAAMPIYYGGLYYKARELEGHPTAGRYYLGQGTAEKPYTWRKGTIAMGDGAYTKD
jgi:hypothetical protein